MNEQQEATDMVGAEQSRQLLAMDAARENVNSMTEVNRALAKVHEARASMRGTFAGCVVIATLAAVGWSVWATVHLW